MREFKVLEKKEQYYVCQTGTSYCRIVVDAMSETLPLGDHHLHVEEITDRYQHKTKETVFRLTCAFEDQGDIGICMLSAGRKNTFVYKRCLQLGGKWEPVLGQWVFSSSVQTQVDELSAIIHSDKVYVEASFEETISVSNQSLTLFGFPLVRSVSQNGRVVLNTGMKLMAGDLSCIGADAAPSQSKGIVLANSRIRLFVPKRMLDDARFHEDFMCVVTVEKKRKPRATKTQASPWMS
ncbi:hypothetical protein [Enterovibrio sp. 27052020O]|uniref:hypothetical protein n=1 Tax=Enterovibrio sp. 27052020O TaxID=3241166 RepID=UPI0038902F05